MASGTKAPGKLIIDSKAPTRADLAGGTVDIWPLYLFLQNPTTINLGIDLFAEAQIEEDNTVSRADAGITLQSGDQGAELNLKWDELAQASAPPALILHLKLLQHFATDRMNRGLAAPQSRFRLSTRAKSPAGAGLGGSSTLSIAMIGALASWARGASAEKPVDFVTEGERFIEIVRDVETTVIQVPAGIQDYYGAMFGGLQSLHWGPGVHSRRWLDHSLLQGMESRILLFYSGQSRNSGINNWALFKAFIDKQGDVRSQFEQISAATIALEKALEAKDWKGAGDAIHAEWDVRRNLAAGISTPEMERAFEAAMKEGATAGKVCGAGGGGCFFVYVPSGDPQLMDRIREKITSFGIRHLPFRASPRGLDVRFS